MKPAWMLVGPALALMLSPRPTTPQTIAAELPSKLEGYLATVVHPTQAERESLLAGQPIAKLLEADPSL